MSDFGTVQADGVHLADRTRADATAYLTRTGNADLLVILGLAADPEARAVPEGLCPVCGNKLASHGGCNRRKACREATHGGAR